MSEAGESLGFEGFVAAQHRNLFSALCLITGDRYEAEDVMQEAFLRIWERWDQVRRMDNPSGYLYRTALNLWRNRTRSAVRALKRRVSVKPRDDLSDVERRADVVRALGRLTPRQRAAIVLLDLLEYTSEEAGHLLKIKASTARVLASQGRAALRQGIGEGHG